MTEAWCLRVVSARGRGRRVYKVCTDDLRACLCRQVSALHMARRRVRNRQGGALCTSGNVSRRAGAHGLGAAHHPPLRWPAGRAHCHTHQTGSWCMCIARSRVPCGRVLSTHLLQRSNSWRFRGVRHEGALREARAVHVNSRLKIAKANNTTHSPRPLPARSMCADHTPPSMTGECRCRAQTARRMPAVHSVWRRFGLICKMITAITVMPGLWQILQTYTFISIPLESRPAWC